MLVDAAPDVVLDAVADPIEREKFLGEAQLHAARGVQTGEVLRGELEVERAEVVGELGGGARAEDG